MGMFKLTLDDSDVTTEREVRCFYEPGESCTPVETASYKVLLNEFLTFLKACGYEIPQKEREHFDAILFGDRVEEEKLDEEESLYLVEHTKSDFNRFCIVKAFSATEARMIAKKQNYDPLWKPGYDKFKLCEFKATKIEKLDGMESGCSLCFG